jgi:hypothetical protein
MWVDTSPAFPPHDIETTKTAEENLFPPEQPLLDGIQDNVYYLLGLDVRQSTVSLMHPFAYIAFIHFTDLMIFSFSVFSFAAGCEWALQKTRTAPAAG